MKVSADPEKIDMSGRVSDDDSSASMDIDDLFPTQNAFLDDDQSDIDVQEPAPADIDFEEEENSSDSDDTVVYDRDAGDIDGAGVANAGFARLSQWSHDDFPTEHRVFDACSGPPRPQKNLQSAFDYFSLVFPAEAFDLMATQTNLYAKQQLMASGVPEELVDDKFEPTTVAEVRAYIGLLMFMNIAPLPSMHMYWQEGSPTFNPWVSSIMPRNRFQELARYFHLADSTTAVPRGQPGYDPLFKVRPLISLTQESFALQFHPGQNLTVDEAMIKFKGRCGFLQYIPAKPTKWGLKVWALCDSDSYYMLNYSVYTGRINDVPAGVGEALGDRVVKHLSAPHLSKWHTIYFDNYFTSITLLEYLFGKDTLACGTVRNNRRGLPDKMKEAKCVKKSGEVLRWFRAIGSAIKRGKLQAIAWFDRRKVNVLTTAHDSSDGEVVRKGPGGVEKARYSRPQAVADYNLNYNGVDKHDQLRAYYGSQLKFAKWWKYVLFFCLDTACVNAYIIYKKSATAPLKKHVDFQMEIIIGMVNGFNGRKRMGRPRARAPGLDKDRHTPSKIQTARGKRDCVLCKREDRKTPAGCAIQSTYECVTCQVALCKDRGCFRSFHQ